MVPDFVQDINTYRYLPTGNIVWYSNCSPGQYLGARPMQGTSKYDPPPFHGVL